MYDNKLWEGQAVRQQCSLSSFHSACSDMLFYRNCLFWATIRLC